MKRTLGKPGHLIINELGERVMQPRYGCNLVDYLFEPLEQYYHRIYQEPGVECHTAYEPRIIAEDLP